MKHIFALLLFGVVTSVTAQGTWTDILNETGSSGEGSGVYKVTNNGFSHALETDLAVYDAFPVQGSGSGPQTVGGYDTDCSTAPGYWTGPTSPYRYPGSALRSNYGPSSGTYKGFGIYGQFGRGTTSGAGSGAGLGAAAFFHEEPCYFGGREYGFAYDLVADSLSYYWSINTNCVSTDCNSGSTQETYQSFSLGSFSNSQYYFEMWPEADGTSCYFRVQVLGPAPDYTVYENITTGDVSSSITSADSSFCSDLENAHGYVTLSQVYTPTVTTIDTTDDIFSVSRVFVGK
jgi:hypothetical protein